MTAQRISEPFFVFDNIHDLLNQTNLGNGLADLLCSYKKDDSGLIKPNPAGFVEYANQKLVGKTTTREIKRLLKYHHPNYTAGPLIKEYVFTLDKSGRVALDDPNLVRIVEIINAHNIIYNQLHEDKLRVLTLEAAAEQIVPQEIILRNNDVDFKIKEYFNAEVMLKSDKKKYTSSLIDIQLFCTIVELINNINYLPSKVKDVSSTELLEKYFGGGDPDYLPGMNTNFYLDEKIQFKLPQIANLNLEVPLSVSNIDKVTESLRANSLDPTLAQRYIKMYMNNLETGKKSDAFEVLTFPSNITLPKWNIIIGIKKIYIPGMGIHTSALPYLAAFYQIPYNLLGSESQGVLDFLYRDNGIIRNHLTIIKRYFNNISQVYEAYRKQAKLERSMK